MKMEPFTFKFGQSPWPAGLTLPHVYVVPDVPRNPVLAELVKACRAALADEPLRHLPDEWLHLTLAQFAVPAPEVTLAERCALARRLTTELADVAPFTVEVGDPLAVRTGILLGVADDDGRLEEVRGRVVSAIRAVRGGQAPVTGHLSPLHMSESYACGHAEDDRIGKALEPVRGRRAPLPVSDVVFTEVSVDQVTKAVTWSILKRIPLGGPALAGSRRPFRGLRAPAST
jgi:hypothetical protein